MYSPPPGASTANGLPWLRSAAATSSSVMAEAIHVTSRCEASPISAVTNPPVPRRISPSGPKVTGPRLETSTRERSGIGSALHLLKQLQPVAQQTRRQEPPACRLLTCAPQLLAEPRIAQDLDRALGAL